MTPEKDGRRRPVLHAQRASAIEKPIHRRAIERPRAAPETVSLRETRQQLEIDFLGETTEGAVAYLVACLEPHARLQMLRDQANHLLPNVVAVYRVDVESIEKRERWPDALLLVIHRSDPSVHERGRDRL